MQWNRRVAAWAVVMVIVLAACAAGGIAIWHGLRGKTPVASGCHVTTGASRYVMDLEQAANATTITLVAKRLGLPDHAVTIALATALQESKLHNLSYGDRDSLGLFQQRPSQGWGTRAQVMEPNYAATAFFQALTHVDGWQTMSVTEAAQAVQRSNAPGAYAVWAPIARTLAIATTGEVPAGLTCQFTVDRSVTTPPSPVPALTDVLGSSALDPQISRPQGWTVASWLVGHAQQYRITSIRFAGQEWTPRGEWKPMNRTDPGVQFTQAASAT